MNKQADVDFAGKTRAVGSKVMNRPAVALVIAAIAFFIHAPGEAQAGQPDGKPQLQQSTCGAHAVSQRDLNRANAARLRKAKANLLAAAAGGHPRPVPEKASPTQLACSDPDSRRAAAGGG